jgi:hypothetical protein
VVRADSVFEILGCRAKSVPGFLALALSLKGAAERQIGITLKARECAADGTHLHQV